MVFGGLLNVYDCSQNKLDISRAGRRGKIDGDAPIAIGRVFIVCNH